MPSYVTEKVTDQHPRMLKSHRHIAAFNSILIKCHPNYPFDKKLLSLIHSGLPDTGDKVLWKYRNDKSLALCTFPPQVILIAHLLECSLYDFMQLQYCIYTFSKSLFPFLYLTRNKNIFYKQDCAFESSQLMLPGVTAVTTYLTFISAWCSRRKSALLLSCRCIAMCSKVCPSDMVSLMQAPEPSSWAAIVCMPGK